MYRSSTIIWLDDQPHSNKNYQLQIEEAGFSLLVAGNLKEFRQHLAKYDLSSKNLAGIILDNLIPTSNLTDLEMGFVMTTNGNDTGFAICQEYLHNKSGDSPIGNEFKNTQVLIFSALSETLMKCRYEGILKFDEKLSIGSKSNEYGEYTNDLIDWLKKL